ncbi:hypothetical protein AGMMS50262_09050 [Bacteroidia bacterium]|nr:hypothetical protein AGMMS50262_09050 [Bacteroidia bacterium]
MKLKNYIFYACGLLLLVSAVLFTTGWPFIPYLYAGTSIGVAVILLLTPYRGNELRLKRLNIQQAIAALILPVSAYLMFLQRNEWFICLLVSGILLGYVACIHDYEEKKKAKND